MRPHAPGVSMPLDVPVPTERWSRASRRSRRHRNAPAASMLPVVPVPTERQWCGNHRLQPLQSAPLESTPPDAKVRTARSSSISQQAVGCSSSWNCTNFFGAPRWCNARRHCIPPVQPVASNRGHAPAPPTMPLHAPTPSCREHILALRPLHGPAGPVKGCASRAASPDVAAGSRNAAKPMVMPACPAAGWAWGSAGDASGPTKPLALASPLC